MHSLAPRGAVQLSSCCRHAWCGVCIETLFLKPSRHSHLSGTPASSAGGWHMCCICCAASCNTRGGSSA